MSATAYSLDYRTKHPAVSVHRYRLTIWLGGLSMSLLLSLAIINYTGQRTVTEVFTPALAPDLEVLPIRTLQRPPVLAPPPPPPEETIITPVEDLVDQPEFVKKDIIPEEVITDHDLSIEDTAAVTHPAPPAPLPLPLAPEEDDLPHRRVEHMPTFPGCSGDTEMERRSCTEQALLRYVSKHLTYPAIARENNVTGTVVLQFVIDRDGLMKDIKLLRDIGAGCGNAAYKVVHDLADTMGAWKPGRQQGRPVPVLYTLPVRMQLE